MRFRNAMRVEEAQRMTEEREEASLTSALAPSDNEK